MPALSTTKMSSRGQVVIPETIRSEMGLKAGVQFVVISQGDAVMLKVLSPPSAEEFAALHKRLRRKARAAGRTQKDVVKAVADVRSRS
ncbi:MAG: AbrB/MazE/SpoVT family DNA-binding domain-containing protein [Thermoguttaceae bacterium]|jgi:AbrB family looped-hinge helix DNA binding protein